MTTSNLKVKFIFESETVFDPKKITELMGIEPDNSYSKGDIFKQAWSDKEKSHKFSVWELSQSAQTYDLEALLDKLLSRIGQTPETIKQIADQFDASTGISVIAHIQSDSSSPAYHLSPTQMSFIDKIGGSFDIDQYIDFDDDMR
jgi:hypothetical protein